MARLRRWQASGSPAFRGRSPPGPDALRSPQAPLEGEQPPRLGFGEAEAASELHDAYRMAGSLLVTRAPDADVPSVVTVYSREPITELVAYGGPFVMNTGAGIA
jgi:hypothetical protein